MTCRLFITYVREKNCSNVQVIITQFIWTLRPHSLLSEQTVKLNHSLTDSHCTVSHSSDTFALATWILTLYIPCHLRCDTITLVAPRLLITSSHNTFLYRRKENITLWEAFDILGKKRREYDRSKFTCSKCAKRIYDLNVHLKRVHGEHISYRESMPEVVEARST